VFVQIGNELVGGAWSQRDALAVMERFTRSQISATARVMRDDDDRNVALAIEDPPDQLQDHAALLGANGRQRLVQKRDLPPRSPHARATAMAAA